jgi:DNA repair protein RecO (recombination protein O)
MKYLSSQAIIMRVKEFGESDLIVTFFTPDAGRLRGVAKGALRSRKRFVNCLDVFSLVNLEYSPSRNSDLCFINSGKLIDAFPGLRNNFLILSKAGYMVELTEILFPLELPECGIFELLIKSFHLLEKGEQVNVVPPAFEFVAMSHGGYRINIERCCYCGRAYTGVGAAVFKPEKGGISCMKCHQVTALAPKLSPDAIRFIHRLYSSPGSAFDELDVDEKILSEIRPVLKLHREYHLGHQPKTASYLE